MTPRTLLIVDDEADVRESLRDALTDEGYNIVVASNGMEALRLLPTLDRPCAVILDLIMPRLSGTEVYSAMRADPALAAIPVLISTSDPSRAPAEVPIATKPIHFERFLTMVADLF